MKKIQLTLTMLFLIGASCNSAWGLGLEAAVTGWDQELGGDLAYKALGYQDKIDLDRETGYSRETKIGGRVKVDLPVLPNVYFMATPMAFSGTGVKATAFTFGDRIFSANVPYTSELSLDHYDLGLYYGFPLLKTATLNTLNLDFGVGVRRLEVQGNIYQAGTGISSSVDETFHFPLGYLALQVQLLKSLRLEGELRGIAYSGNHFYDAIGRVKYTLPIPVFLAGGWRYEDVELDESDIRATITVSGPFAEVGVSF